MASSVLVLLRLPEDLYSGLISSYVRRFQVFFALWIVQEGRSMSSMSKNPIPRPAEAQTKVLIIGAGITGLVLGQALKTHDIAFSIFERDPSVSARGRGWGLTIHWALDALIALLPQHILDRLPEVYVDPEASKKGENGNFLFFDLRSGETRWKVPPNKRIRVSRERLRALLLEGLDVQWSKTLTSFTQNDTESSIIAHFSDSSSATGTLLVGADGLRSHVRATLLSHDPHLAANQELPVRFLGVRVIHPASFALKMRTLDPFFLQGGDPLSDAFMWFSFLDTPSNNSRSENTDTFECQVMVGWPYRKGFMGLEEPLDVPPEGKERLALMKMIAEGWAEPFRECVIKIPDGTTVQAIRLEDFVPRRGMWDNLHGRVTMVGDAAHAMTMFRGDGANHGITDVSVLLSNILPILGQSSAVPTAVSPSLKDAVDAYEHEMIERTAPAVLASRRACLDAHDYKRITDQSPLVSRRAMVTHD